MFPNATTVVFNGKVTGTMSIPNAQRVYVKGVAGGVTLTGGLRMNTGGSATCAARGAGSPRAQLVIGGGGISAASGSDFHFCSTTVILAEGWNTVCPIPTVKPALGTPGNAPVPSNGCAGTVSVTANGSIDWTAPNVNSGQSNSSEWNSLEDLALWTESSSGTALGGGGGLSASGVFFAPNASVTISGGSDSLNPLNAQFVSRTLSLTGNATLYLRPSPYDAVTIPLAPSFGLVR